MSRREVNRTIEKAAREGWTELDLSNKGVMSLPDGTRKLTKLVTLNLWNNRLKKVPPCIVELTLLEELNLASNMLYSLPPEFGGLSSLTDLDLAGNLLSALPVWIGRLRRLMRINLDNNMLSALCPEVGQLKSLVDISLRRNRLTSLPPEIGDLRHLKRLVLDCNGIESFPAQIGRLSKLGELSLLGNRLKALPPEIGQLGDLKRLNIDGNELGVLPAQIGGLTKLKELSLSFNRFNILPGEIGQLTNLVRLELQGNQLGCLPPEIGRLSKLTKLDLRDNELRLLPPQIGCLTELTELDLQDNELKSLPPEIGRLASLKQLRLYGNELMSLPAQIGCLTELTELDLRGSQLTSLPEEISRLTALTRLELYGNKLKSLPSGIGQLTKLTQLDLRGSGLMSLPPGIGQLTGLTQLELHGNRLTSLPPEIGRLTGLTRLDLRGSKVTLLPEEIGQLTELRELDLTDNNLQRLPVELGQLGKLGHIWLGGNPLELPPPEVAKRGTKAVLAYLRELGRKEREEWVSKLILVGEGGVGKTSLLKRLLGEGFDPREKTTHGLQIRTLEQAHPGEPDVTMRLNAWDFGGQYILHATHQFFLTKRSLFVLVWNARHGWQQGKVHYWLDIMKARAPESPVLIVATHTEHWPGDLPYEEIRTKYPQVRGRFSVSNKKGTGIDAVEEAIRHEAADLPLMGEAWPATWLDVAEAVRQLRKSKAYIYPNELDEVMRNEQVTIEDREILSTWLHDLGDLLYFKDNAELSDIVILDTEWVASNISHMLEDAEIEKGLGIFKRDHMDAVWPEIEPPVRDVFLRLMEQFDLSFRTLEDKDISIVVERLSLDPSESAKGYKELWDARQGESEITMKFCVNTSLPPGIPTWFIARSHRFTTYKHWRYGALFADGEERKHLGLVQAYDHERYLSLSVRGPGPHNFFALLRDGLELTLDRYPGLHIEYRIPCPGHQGTKCEHEFDLSQLEKALGKKKMLIQCPEALEEVSVAEMLFGLRVGTVSDLDKLIRDLEAKVEVLRREFKHDHEKQTVLLEQIGENIALMQRGFTSLFNSVQELEESHCPNVFAVLPKGGKTWLKNILGQKMVLQLYCQAPGQWHPMAEGGQYEIKRTSQWLSSMGPYIVKLAKAIKYAAPVAGAAASLYAGPIATVMGKGIGDKLAKQVKLMEELAKKITDDKGLAAMELREGIGGREGPERIEGAALRVLRKLLDEVDPGHHWGGLKKILTPEGHYLWLCEYHAAEYAN